jgi:hypothetical protein
MHSPGGWQAVDARLRVVRLSRPLRLLVPALMVATIPLKTRAVSYEGGAFGAAVGALVVAGSLAVGWAFYPLAGAAGVILPLWLLGSAGLVMVVNGVRPVAFVKPICVRCRLLPVIREHESIHLAGVESDDAIWSDMRTRHSRQSLAVEGDPRICSFCPIPARLGGS